MTDFSRVFDALGTQFVELSNSESYIDLFAKSIFHDDPAIQILSMTLLNSCLVFVLGLLTKQYSWVDKLWSIAPIYYAWTIARRELEQGEWYPRATIAFLLVCIWGIRLSYNFWRKGGYAWDGEDYRWPIVKKSMNPFVFFVFHLVFIAFMQNLLLASLLAPIYACWKFGEENGHVPSFNVLDVLGIILASGFLIIEAVADQQQWIFHKRKHSRKLTAAEKKKGFLTTGLWKYSRHPNFFAEQAFWWSQCVFAAAGCGKWLGWWLVAPLCLTLLFQGSTGLTEDISSSKYPLYAEYQRTTPRLIPFFKL